MLSTSLGTRIVGGAASTITSGFTGLQIASTVGGIVGVAASVTLLTYTILKGNRVRRREYAEELKKAKEEGAQEERRIQEQRIRDIIDELSQARHDRDFYREQFFRVRGFPKDES